MAKQKTVHAYELELKRMIKERTGKDCELWLMPQVRATAMNTAMLAKIQEELDNETRLLLVTPGSTGQITYTSHPLLAQYDKMQRTLLQQYEALGLSYRSTPSKITENTKQGGEEHDKLMSLMGDINSIK